MSELIPFADYKRQGPEAVQALLAFELAPGVTVHAAAWVFAMPEAEFAASDADPERMAGLLADAGLAFFAGNDDQPPNLVLRDVDRFRRRFHPLACREAALTALGTGILIRRDPARCV